MTIYDMAMCTIDSDVFQNRVTLATLMEKLDGVLSQLISIKFEVRQIIYAGTNLNNYYFI